MIITFIMVICFVHSKELFIFTIIVFKTNYVGVNFPYIIIMHASFKVSDGYYCQFPFKLMIIMFLFQNVHRKEVELKELFHNLRRHKDHTDKHKHSSENEEAKENVNCNRNEKRRNSISVFLRKHSKKRSAKENSPEKNSSLEPPSIRKQSSLSNPAINVISDDSEAASLASEKIKVNKSTDNIGNESDRGGGGLLSPVGGLLSPGGLLSVPSTSRSNSWSSADDEEAGEKESVSMSMLHKLAFVSIFYCELVTLVTSLKLIFLSL